MNQADNGARHRQEDAPRHAVLVAQDAKSFDAPNPVFDRHSVLGNFAVAFFLFRRQCAAFGSLLRGGDLRMPLIGISLITEDRFVTQGCWQFLLELAFFVELDVGLRAAMAALNVEDVAFAVGDDLGLDRVWSLLA